MPTQPSGPDPVTRLRTVQDRVRTLVRRHVWFADAMRKASDDIWTLDERFESRRDQMRELERRQVRQLLESGRLVDPEVRNGRPGLFMRLEGLLPESLAARLREYSAGDAIPEELEGPAARALLEALDLEPQGQTPAPPDQGRGAIDAARLAEPLVPFSWRVAFLRPSNWEEPADPFSLQRSDLDRFTDDEYRTIALYRLGGLADVGSFRPLVRQPPATGEPLRDFAAYVAWRTRLPINDLHRHEHRPPLDVDALSPDDAEQLLEDILVWAEREATRRGESLTGSGTNPRPDQAGSPHHATAALEPGVSDLSGPRAAEKIDPALGGDDAPVARLPELQPHDTQAWQLSLLHGLTQAKVAETLNREHGTTYRQGQVSRMINRAKAHAQASGLAEKVAGRIDRPRTVDPGRLELGARVDKRAPRPSDLARADDDED